MEQKYIFEPVMSEALSSFIIITSMIERSSRKKKERKEKKIYRKANIK